jgi:hypothetical protein
VAISTLWCPAIQRMKLTAFNLAYIAVISASGLLSLYNDGIIRRHCEKTAHRDRTGLSERGEVVVSFLAALEHVQLLCEMFFAKMFAHQRWRLVAGIESLRWVLGLALTNAPCEFIIFCSQPWVSVADVLPPVKHSTCCYFLTSFVRLQSCCTRLLAATPRLCDDAPQIRPN